MLMSNGATAPHELRDLRITTCARIARVHRDRIHEAMRDGALAFHRDAEGYRVATLDSLVEWMRGGAAR
jgi:hypothetical protein